MPWYRPAVRSTIVAIVVEDAGQLKLRDPFEPERELLMLVPKQDTPLRAGDWVRARLDHEASHVARAFFEERVATAELAGYLREQVG